MQRGTWVVHRPVVPGRWRWPLREVRLLGDRSFLGLRFKCLGRRGWAPQIEGRRPRTPEPGKSGRLAPGASGAHRY